MGAWEETPVQACRQMALSVPGTATVLGTGWRASGELAAFANCAAFRYLDFHDTYVGRHSVHPSDNIAAGRLMKLDPVRLSDAVNIAVDDHIPLSNSFPFNRA